MSFDTRNGTRGARQPSGRLWAWVNRVMARRVRARGGKGRPSSTLVLTTIGARSGQEREIPLARFDGGDGTWLVVASAAGAPRNPAWYYNVAAHPDRVRVDVDGKSIDVVASQLHGAEREDAWARILATAPQFGGYAKATDRVLPVIRLTPRD